MKHDDHAEQGAYCTPRRFNWIPIAFLAIAAFFLISEHRAHVMGVLPYLFLLACPLMHLFMHHGHNNRDQHNHGSSKGEQK